MESNNMLDEDDLPLKQIYGKSSVKSVVDHFNDRQDVHQTVQSHDPLDLCCCCLELFCTKTLWLEYSWMGQSEVYGEMLRDCFNVTFPAEWHCREKICEVCITRLRNSYKFKRQIVGCQAKLAEKVASIEKHNTLNTDLPVKLEDKDLEYVHQEKSYVEIPTLFKMEVENLNKNNCNDSRNDNSSNPHTTDNANHNDSERENADDYCDNESNTANGDEIKGEPKVKLKIGKGFKLKRTSLKNVDRRTLSAHRSDYVKPRQNVGLLLEHSTIMPFKSNKGYFNCLYCNKQYIVFEELRSHVLDLHQSITFRTILKSILRPNDRIKADISDMTCRRCGVRSDTLQKLIEHLEIHSVKFNYEEKLLKPTDCVLPYDLSDGKYKCSVCHSEFPFFKTLTKHMNDHSTNYVCDSCGKCFMLQERLRAHVTIHANSAAVNCEHCGKICASNAHLRSHKRHHHKKRSHVCCICNKSFATFKERMQHLQDVHNRTPPDLDCKICFKRFKTTSHLGCHIRTEHYNIPYVRKRKNKREDIHQNPYSMNHITVPL